MRKKAWVSQLAKQVAKFGADTAPWYVHYYDPDGRLRCKSCGPGKKGQRDAKKLADKYHSQLVTGTFETGTKETWEAFRKAYQARVVDSMGVRSKEAAKQSLDRFEEVSSPRRMRFIDATMIDSFIAVRRKSKGRGGKLVSAATVNKDLRYIRAALRMAHEWGFLAKVPRFRLLKQVNRLPTFITPEHFTAIYQACDGARRPGDLPNVSAPDWWRGLLVTAYMTGWRIGQVLALRWEQVDLDAGTAVSLGEDNKGRRDVRIPLHPLIVEHLRKLAGSFDSHVFPWNHHSRTLWVDFAAIQNATRLGTGDDAKPLPKGGKNGGWYGFHDLRRGFATMNAEGIDLFRLQALMQHKDLETTRGYVNLAKSLRQSVEGLYVPEIPKAKAGG